MERLVKSQPIQLTKWASREWARLFVLMRNCAGITQQQHRGGLLPGWLAEPGICPWGQKSYVMEKIILDNICFVWYSLVTMMMIISMIGFTLLALVMTIVVSFVAGSKAHETSKAKHAKKHGISPNLRF